jgi:hypothetical protein
MDTGKERVGTGSMNEIEPVALRRVILWWKMLQWKMRENVGQEPISPRFTLIL